MTAPAVSVCMPAYNAADSIGETIQSVLAQDFDDFELVVVDNASEDGTGNIVAEHRDERIRLVRNDHLISQSENTNRAIALARADLVKFLHADDTLDPDCLSAFVPWFANHPRVGLAFSRRRVEFEDPRSPLAVAWLRNHGNPHRGFGVLREVNDGRELFERYLLAGFPANWVGEPSCVMVRRECMVQCGALGLRLRAGVDIDLWLRLMAHYDVAFIDRVLCTYRFHLRGVTGEQIRTDNDWMDRLWMLEGLSTFADLWRSYPRLARLRREEVRRKARDLVALGRRGRLREHHIPDTVAYLRYRALRLVGRPPPLLGYPEPLPGAAALS